MLKENGVYKKLVHAQEIEKGQLEDVIVSGSKAIFIYENVVTNQLICNSVFAFQIELLL